MLGALNLFPASVFFLVHATITSLSLTHKEFRHGDASTAIVMCLFTGIVIFAASASVNVQNDNGSCSILHSVFGHGSFDLSSSHFVVSPFCLE